MSFSCTDPCTNCRGLGELSKQTGQGEFTTVDCDGCGGLGQISYEIS